MGKVYDVIGPELQSWLQRQKVFFVATAPLSPEGHVNCSPKGGDTFRILGDREVAYLDLTGSGIETIAHLRENGRIVILFCAFDGAPKIIRFHGVGQAVYPQDPDYAKLSGQFSSQLGARAVIRVQVTRISDSCGFGVPLLHFAAERDALAKWTEKKGPAGLPAYRARKNASSIDGIRGYEASIQGSANSREVP